MNGDHHVWPWPFPMDHSEKRRSKHKALLVFGTREKQEDDFTWRNNSNNISSVTFSWRFPQYNVRRSRLSRCDIFLKMNSFWHKRNKNKISIESSRMNRQIDTIYCLFADNQWKSMFQQNLIRQKNKHFDIDCHAVRRLVDRIHKFTTTTTTVRTTCRQKNWKVCWKCKE